MLGVSGVAIASCGKQSLSLSLFVNLELRRLEHPQLLLRRSYAYNDRIEAWKEVEVDSILSESSRTDTDMNKELQKQK